jgi:cystinosin
MKPCNPNTTSILILIFILFLSITTIITSIGRMDLLLLMYFYSYVKLTISGIKYIPQMVMNYRRKSTEGWSIGNILLDLIGGILSLLQMCLLAINYSDWSSIFGSLSKFGLGVLSIGFDLIFIVQHYILYKTDQQQQQPNGYQILDNNEATTETAVNA